MLRTGRTILSALALAGCAAHEVYDRPDLDLATARADWADCQRSALAETGAPAPGGIGNASVRGGHLVAEVAVDPEPHDVAGYTPAEWLRIARRRKLRQECMAAKGYRFLGIPVTERL